MTFKKIYTELKTCYFNAYAKGVEYNGKYMSNRERYHWLDRIYDYEMCGSINHYQAGILVTFVYKNSRTDNEETKLLLKSSN